MKNKFVIIDGNAIIHRAYHAIPPMNVKDGTMVNAVYGFTSMLLKVLSDLKPTHLAISFDVSGGTFRDKIYTDYKATRVKADQDLYDQIPLCYQIVEAFDIPIYTKEGFEADDVIGTIVNTPETKNKKEIECVIVTGDKDLLQLVDDDRVEVYLLRKGLSDYHLYNDAEVKKQFGFGPELMVDFKALRGDASDNIPGVKGIGEKTATELIQKIGGIEDIYNQVKSRKEKVESIKDSVLKKLAEGEPGARMSYELAKISTDVLGLKFNLKDCEAKVFDIKKIEDTLRRFEFFSLLKRIPGAEAREIDKNLKAEKKAIKNVEKINTPSEIKKLVANIKKEKIFACKEIINGKNIIDGELKGLVFAVRDKTYYVDGWQNELKNIFEDEQILLVGHDLKQLLKALFGLAKTPMVTCKLFDMMVASYIINSSTRAHDLRSIAMRELNQELAIGSSQASLFGSGPEPVAEELGWIFELYERFEVELKKMDNLGLFEKMEMALVPVLARMELNGVLVDSQMLGKMSKDVNDAIEKVIKKIWKEAGQEFNVASSIQLREVLFEKMGLPAQGIKKGKTGFSTAAPELEKLRGMHPIIELIEEHRELEKLRNTYIDVLPGLVSKKTGRIHTTYNQAVTTTGRLSSSDPNLQNIPIRTELGREVRNAFVATPGNCLVVADYSQIELRIVASLAKDKTMLKIFEQGEDIHTATAAAINGVKLSEVTREMRSAAKAVNFGVLYGMGSYGLSWRTGISNAEARDFIAKYFQEFSGVKKYLDNIIKVARTEGYVETLLGRRRYIPELSSDNFQVRSSGERMAINMPIQGTAADLIKLAMIEVDKNIETSKQLNKNVIMILQVHDELVLEVKKGLEDEVSKMVKKAMENVMKLRVPIEVDVHVGQSWGEVK